MLPEHLDPADMIPDPHGRDGHWIHVPSGNVYALAPDWQPEVTETATAGDGLDALPYKELQQAARDLGIAPNQSKEKLIAALREGQKSEKGETGEQTDGGQSAPEDNGEVK